MKKVKNITITLSIIAVLALCLVNAPRDLLFALQSVLAASPELLVLFDLGGLELVISFLLLYFSPLIIKLQILHQRIKQEVGICVSALRNSALLQPKVYLTHALFYCCGTAVIGSFAYASLLFAPIMLMNQHFC